MKRKYNNSKDINLHNNKRVKHTLKIEEFFNEEINNSVIFPVTIKYPSSYHFKNNMFHMDEHVESELYYMKKNPSNEIRINLVPTKKKTFQTSCLLNNHTSKNLEISISSDQDLLFYKYNGNVVPNVVLFSKELNTSYGCFLSPSQSIPSYISHGGYLSMKISIPHWIFLNACLKFLELNLCQMVGTYFLHY